MDQTVVGGSSTVKAELDIVFSGICGVEDSGWCMHSDFLTVERSFAALLADYIGEGMGKSYQPFSP